MSELHAKHLADGVLSMSVTPLYTVPGGSTAMLRSLLIVNKTAGAVTVNLFANFGTGNRQLSPKDLLLPPGAKYEDLSQVTLEAGDELLGIASAVTAVDYIISGVLQT